MDNYQKYKQLYDTYFFNKWLNNIDIYSNKNKKRIRNKMSREEYLKRYDIKKNGAHKPITIEKYNITLFF